MKYNTICLMLNNRTQPVAAAVVALDVVVERKDVALGTSLSVYHPPRLKYKMSEPCKGNDAYAPNDKAKNLSVH